MSGWTIVLIIAAVLIAGAAGVLIAELMARGVFYSGWQRRGRHRCGHVTPDEVTQDHVCRRCGEIGNWENPICRMRFYGRMEFKTGENE